MHLEEELKLSVEKSKNTIAHLHVQMSSLKSALEETNVDLEDRKDKIIFLEKETKRKDEIIQHMNAGFNKKVSDLNAKIEYLEKKQTKRASQGEKKLQKKSDKKIRKMQLHQALNLLGM